MSHIYEKPDNLVALIEGSVKKYSDLPLFGNKNSNGEYEWTTYGQIGTRIDHLRAGLSSLGIKKGGVVGIVANNRSEWAVAAFATYGLQARFIPMYEKELEKTWKYICQDSEIQVLFVANTDIYHKILAFRDELPKLEHLFLIDGSEFETMSELEKKGEKNPVPSTQPPPDQIAMQIYTSGTTGNPKGVLLSHGNFSSNFIAGGKLYKEYLASGAVSISILPWAHSFGLTAELYNFLNFGGAMGFAESVATFAEDMKSLKPTFLIAVPRVFNRVHGKIWEKINSSSPMIQKLFKAGLKAAKKRRELGGSAGFLTDLKYKLVDRIVFKKIRNNFGGRLEAAVTASAMMNVEINHFFCDINIPIYECYGLTETSPAATMNGPDANKPGSVGRPIEHVKIVIEKLPGDNSGSGEVIIYGPNVMQGYHNNPKATEDAMTPDGGLRTGDCGHLDEDGFLFITGRFKEQYKLENGMYVFPSGIEEDIKLHPYVTNAMIYGDGRPFNICVIVPNYDELLLDADKYNLPKDPDEFFKRPDLQEIIGDVVTKPLKDKYISCEIPKKFIFQKEEFSLENGMLTQTLKLKRAAALNKYGPLIEKLYETDARSRIVN